MQICIADCRFSCKISLATTNIRGAQVKYNNASYIIDGYVMPQKLSTVESVYRLSRLVTSNVLLCASKETKNGRGGTNNNATTRMTKGQENILIWP